MQIERCEYEHEVKPNTVGRDSYSASPARWPDNGLIKGTEQLITMPNEKTIRPPHSSDHIRLSLSFIPILFAEHEYQQSHGLQSLPLATDQVDD